MRAQAHGPPGSPDFIPNDDGYYAFLTYTLFRGKVRAGIVERRVPLV